jgi:hypothetical protein
VKHLFHRRIFEKALQPRSFMLAPSQADAAHPILAIADLHKAKPVSAMHQPHGLRIHSQGSRLAEESKPFLIEIAIEHCKTGWRRG